MSKHPGGRLIGRFPLFTSIAATISLAAGVSCVAEAQAASTSRPHTGKSAAFKTTRVRVTGEAIDTVHPTQVIGDGQPASCTSAAVVRAVAAGGIITFRCGPKPKTIVMRHTAVVPNTTLNVVIDGGGKITLSGAGKRRILFSDTCRGTWATSDCVNQPYPQIVVQNITFEKGHASAAENINCTQNAAQCWYGGVDGGGAIYVEGGRFEAIHDHFTNNSCRSTGPDLGGGAIRVVAQYDDRPVYAAHDSFTGNRCSNGGALSSLSVGWRIRSSSFDDNAAVGWGGNPANAKTPGGGSGGAIYLDGVNDNVVVTKTSMRGNTAREGGGAVFDVVDEGYGALRFFHSQLTGNTSGVFQNAPGIFDEVDGNVTAPLFAHSVDQ